MARNFREMLEAKWAEGKFVCVGLDSESSKIPESAFEHVGDAGLVDLEDTIVAFNHAIVEATKDIVSAYKPNIAFYEAHGAEGIAALHRTIVDIHIMAPDVPVILDAKRADIGNTNAGYVEAAFDFLRADAITVHPYLGAEALKPFLDRKDKGVIVLCRTSNPGASEFQDLPLHSDSHIRPIGVMTAFHGTRLYQQVAHSVAQHWNKNGNCALVVGATYPSELRKVREIIGDMPILIPGIGTQGGNIEATVNAGKDSRGRGMIINSSRGIIFASSGSDFALAARRETLKLHTAITECLATKA
ncbi:MAG: orotidine-5'-phosphate decarboxylase [Minisyncoccia bacterium]